MKDSTPANDLIHVTDPDSAQIIKDAAGDTGPLKLIGDTFKIPVYATKDLTSEAYRKEKADNGGIVPFDILTPEDAIVNAVAENASEQDHSTQEIDYRGHELYPPSFTADEVSRAVVYQVASILQEVKGSDAEAKPHLMRLVLHSNRSGIDDRVDALKSCASVEECVAKFASEVMHLTDGICTHEFKSTCIIEVDLHEVHKGPLVNLLKLYRRARKAVIEQYFQGSK